MSAVGVAGPVRDGPPEQAGELDGQAGLVDHGGQNPISAAFAQVGGMVALVVQRVNGYHRLHRSPIWSSSGAKRVISLALPSTSVLTRTTPAVA